MAKAFLGRASVKAVGSASPNDQPSQSTKDKVTKACVDFITEDLCPFDVVAGKGFMDLIDVLSTLKFHFFLKERFELGGWD